VRKTILALFSLLVPALLVAPAQAPKKGKEKDKYEVKMPDNARKATAKALAWLATKQNNDGSWSESRYPHNPAITSFALLAFLSQGHLPNQGLYGKQIAKGTRYLMSCSRPNGYLIGTRGGNMYVHGMATLTLAEMWGLTNDKEIKPILQKAVDLIVNAQAKNEGGWRYSPSPSGSDISVTVMQVMALRPPRTRASTSRTRPSIRQSAISGIATTSARAASPTCHDPSRAWLGRRPACVCCTSPARPNPRTRKSSGNSAGP